MFLLTSQNAPPGLFLLSPGVKLRFNDPGGQGWETLEFEEMRIGGGKDWVVVRRSVSKSV